MLYCSNSYYWLKKENFIVLLQHYLLTTFNTILCQWPISPDKQWTFYQTTQYFKDVVRKLSLMIIFWVSSIVDMERGCTKNSALVSDQKTFSFQRKLNLNFTQKKLFCKSVMCKRVVAKFEAGFCPLYWVSSGG